MHWYRSILAGLVILLSTAGALLYLRFNRTEPETELSKDFTGSASCRDCHQDFYERWAPSRHGLTMQPYTPEFAKAELTPQSPGIVVGEFRYRAEIASDEGWISETGRKACIRNSPSSTSWEGRTFITF